MNYDMQKVAIIGCGMAGTSYGYALLNQHLCRELVLVDLNIAKAQGEAMDLNHALAFSDSNSNMKIYAGTYRDASDADIVAICAGAAQKSGENQLSLMRRNREVIHSIVDNLLEYGFQGIFLVATNPVDIMTMAAIERSGFDAGRVIGTGTTADSARLRWLLGNYFGVDPKNIHAYVIGEHGDSQFVPWSQAMIATKSVLDTCDDNPKLYRYEDILKIEKDVKKAAHEIADAKGAAYYGVGMALTRITKAIFGNENSILTVSSLLYGEYGQYHVCISTPCIVNRSGIREKLRLPLAGYELKQLDNSCNILREFSMQGSKVT